LTLALFVWADSQKPPTETAAEEATAIFIDQWQRRIRRELVESTRRSVLAGLIGEPGAAKVEEFSAWLEYTKHRFHVLQYLYRD
jgi:hypothetical protein